ncbi:putative gag-polypeptide of LTR copia-type [Lyophyllum shimeji]|uniref:Gag-polypeptide of LTR copia-type n=1 Tax=Lyophyllum shimeji TaxID=47721 RepID=A0A9P3UTG8_LYOSH|nr:putative gag-polypeptide of LTR copia-type [Lyophyllum shimeji]
MSINQLLHSVPKLGASKSDGTLTSYQDWKFAISMVLRRAGCWEVMSKEKPSTREAQATWEAKAEEALTAIGLTLDPSQYQYIQDATDGVDAWKKLQKIYEKNSRANRISLMRQFYYAHHDPHMPIEDYINGIIKTANQLKSIGMKIEDFTIVDVLIMNLDETWSSIAGSLGATTQDDTAISAVTGALIDEQTRRNANNHLGDIRYPDTALVGKHATDINCYLCGKKGHLARNCREARKNEKGKTDAQNNGSASQAPDRANVATDDYAF